MEFKRFENETDEELIYRICSQKEEIGSWQQVADILNELTDNMYTESKYRKQFQAFQKMMNANRSKFVDNNSQLKEINERIRDLKKSEVKFRDERNAWNKQNYVSARIEQKLDYLEEMLSNVKNIHFSDYSSIYKDGIQPSGKDLLISLADLHIGQTFSNNFGKYDTDIAEKRLNEYLEKIVSVGRLHNAENVYVVILGDSLSGNIHLSIQVSNRENVIEQIKLSAELISNFCIELSKYFKNVYVHSVDGNHSRLISDKEMAIKDERLDSLITWIVSKITKPFENITVNTFNIDSSICKFKIRNNVYIGVHGDYDNMNQNNVGKLCMMLGEIPNYILSGHKHTPASQEFNGLTWYQCGSLVGSGDDYTLSKRLSGKPSQSIFICGYDGVECVYNPKFD